MTLRIKTIIVVISVLLPAFGSVIAINWRHTGEVRSMVDSCIEREGMSLLIATSEALSLSLPSRDYSLVEEYGRTLVNERTGIIRLEILDEDGESLFSYRNQDHPDARALDADRGGVLTMPDHLALSRFGDSLAFLAPLQFSNGDAGEKVKYGYVVLQLSKGQVEARLSGQMGD